MGLVSHTRLIFKSNAKVLKIFNLLDEGEDTIIVGVEEFDELLAICKRCAVAVVVS
jgi:hypothetical protein